MTSCESMIFVWLTAWQSNLCTSSKSLNDFVDDLQSKSVSHCLIAALFIIVIIVFIDFPG